MHKSHFIVLSFIALVVAFATERSNKEFNFSSSDKIFLHGHDYYVDLIPVDEEVAVYTVSPRKTVAN